MTYRDNDFVSDLLLRCQKLEKSIALPEISDHRVWTAASKLISQKAVKFIHTSHLRDDVISLCTGFGVDFATYEPMLRFLDQKSEEPAIVTAGRLLNEGQVDAALAGAVSTTAEVIRATISTIGLAPGNKTVSGAFLMHRDSDNQTFLFADSGVVIDPTEDQMLDIARCSVETWKKIGDGTPPSVAFLSFSTKGSAVHPLATKVSSAASKFKSLYPDITSSGELQFDAALIPEIGQRKCPGDPVAGKANIFIFPDLNSGNIGYKIAQYLGGFQAFGPILQGANKPYSDLSRGASVEDIMVSAYINIIRSEDV